uniref:Uncharacterized protein n=1 Tax=Wuchereria bancrofti TaxID=6293 RepID=A0AAF5PUJ6_WUCBA
MGSTERASTPMHRINLKKGFTRPLETNAYIDGWQSGINTFDVTRATRANAVIIIPPKHKISS